MKRTLIVAAALLTTSAAFAQAANNRPSNQTTNNAPSTQAQSQQQTQTQGQQQTTAQIAQQIKKNLQQAGFKDIRLVPSSFIVRAEDQNNNPVMMVINPDSVTALSAIPQNGQKTTGQAPSDGTGSAPHQTGQQ